MQYLNQFLMAGIILVIVSIILPPLAALVPVFAGVLLALASIAQIFGWLFVVIGIIILAIDLFKRVL